MLLKNALCQFSEQALLIWTLVLLPFRHYKIAGRPNPLTPRTPGCGRFTDARQDHAGLSSNWFAIPDITDRETPELPVTLGLGWAGRRPCSSLRFWRCRLLLGRRSPSSFYFVCAWIANRQIVDVHYSFCSTVNAFRHVVLLYRCFGAALRVIVQAHTQRCEARRQYRSRPLSLKENHPGSEIVRKRTWPTFYENFICPARPTNAQARIPL